MPMAMPASAPAPQPREKKKTPADVDRMVKEGLVDAETAVFMKDKLRELEAASAAAASGRGESMPERGGRGGFRNDMGGGRPDMGGGSGAPARGSMAPRGGRGGLNGPGPSPAAPVR